MGFTAVITGASQGIGEAIAIALASEPEARLYLLARNEDTLNDVAARCERAGAFARALVCDVTDESAVAKVADELLGRGDIPDLLVNNAGQFTETDLFATTADEFRKCLDTNLVSAFLVTRSLAPAMIERGHGTIFFMGSVASTQGYAMSGPYTAAKHGLLGLARSVRKATQTSGIRVTAILPGATESPSWDTASLPEHRLMPAEDIAQSVLSIFKLSPQSVVEEIVLRPQLGDV